MIINGIDMPNFKSREFSEDPDEHAHPYLLEAVQKYRTLLGHPFIPSPTPGALARFEPDDMKSMHYALAKMSKALDGFPDCDIFEAFLIAVRSGLFGGVGVYLDTQLKGSYKPMLHLDLRETPLMWYRAGGVYKYDTAPDFYQELLSQFNMHKVYYRGINRK
jgi:hypothetical protein